jgi:hypothetical protein
MIVLQVQSIFNSVSWGALWPVASETAKSTPQRRGQRLAEGDSASRGTPLRA